MFLHKTHKKLKESRVKVGASDTSLSCKKAGTMKSVLLLKLVLLFTLKNLVKSQITCDKHKKFEFNVTKQFFKMYQFNETLFIETTELMSDIKNFKILLSQAREYLSPTEESISELNEKAKKNLDVAELQVFHPPKHIGNSPRLYRSKTPIKKTRHVFNTCHFYQMANFSPSNKYVSPELIQHLISKDCDSIIKDQSTMAICQGQSNDTDLWKDCMKTNGDPNLNRQCGFHLRLTLKHNLLLDDDDKIIQRVPFYDHVSSEDPLLYLLLYPNDLLEKRRNHQWNPHVMTFDEYPKQQNYSSNCMTYQALPDSRAPVRTVSLANSGKSISNSTTSDLSQTESEDKMQDSNNNEDNSNDDSDEENSIDESNNSESTNESDDSNSQSNQNSNSSDQDDSNSQGNQSSNSNDQEDDDGSGGVGGDENGNDEYAPKPPWAKTHSRSKRSDFRRTNPRECVEKRADRHLYCIDHFYNHLYTSAQGIDYMNLVTKIIDLIIQQESNLETIGIKLSNASAKNFKGNVRNKELKIRIPSAWRSTTTALKQLTRTPKQISPNIMKLEDLLFRLRTLPDIFPHYKGYFNELISGRQQKTAIFGGDQPVDEKFSLNIIGSQNGREVGRLITTLVNTDTLFTLATITPANVAGIIPMEKYIINDQAGNYNIAMIQNPLINLDCKAIPFKLNSTPACQGLPPQADQPKQCAEALKKGETVETYCQTKSSDNYHMFQNFCGTGKIIFATPQHMYLTQVCELNPGSKLYTPRSAIFTEQGKTEINGGCHILDGKNVLYFGSESSIPHRVTDSNYHWYNWIRYHWQFVKTRNIIIGLGCSSVFMIFIFCSRTIIIAQIEICDLRQLLHRARRSSIWRRTTPLPSNVIPINVPPPNYHDIFGGQMVVNPPDPVMTMPTATASVTSRSSRSQSGRSSRTRTPAPENNHSPNLNSILHQPSMNQQPLPSHLPNNATIPRRPANLHLPNLVAAGETTTPAEHHPLLGALPPSTTLNTTPITIPVTSSGTHSSNLIRRVIWNPPPLLPFEERRHIQEGRRFLANT